MTRIETLLRLGAFFTLILLACCFVGAEARAASPEVKSFVIPSSHRTLTVPVIRLTATDDIAITGYKITESADAPLVSDTGWTVTPQAKYTFNTEGNKTLYAWVKDADGNVSTSLSADTCIGGVQQLNKTFISAGEEHTVALKSDGTVAAWGYGAFGQTAVPDRLSGAVAIAAGGGHTVALQSVGTVTAWGDNTWGQAIVPIGLTDVVAIAAGGQHSVALKSDGTVTAWGDNASGQALVPEALNNVVAIAAGGFHTVALKSDGTVTAWGLNTDGRTTIPPGLTGVVAIAAGNDHTVVLKSDGTVVAWGLNTDGQTTIPGGLTNVVAISAGYSHTVALKSDGTVVAWGKDNHGQSTIPGGLAGVVAISAGLYHTVALKSDGTVTAWGDNNYGQTTIPEGLTNTVAIAAGGQHSSALRADGSVSVWGRPNFSLPPMIAGAPTSAVAISAGYGFTVALTSDGTVTVWPSNSSALTTIPVGLADVVAISADFEHTAALRSDGSIESWGYNNYDETIVPGGLTEVVALSTGDGFTVALKSDGTVTAWGRNDCSQTKIPEGLTEVVAISAGGLHAAALRSDGTVTAWGYNGYGETTIPEGLADVVAIAAGVFHTVALKSDGTVTTWGSHVEGEMTIPAGLSHVVAIAASRFPGGNHTVALKSDGTVAAWGAIGYGESHLPAVGPDTTAPEIFRFAPAPISRMSVITIPAFVATDDTGVAGYLITESSTPPDPAGTGWKATPPAFFAVGAEGSHTLYAWAKDAADNISSPAIATVTVSADTTPNAFSFTAVTNAEQGVLYPSVSATISGINHSATVSITGGEYSVSGGPYTSGSGIVNNGDQVTVRQTSSASYSTKTDAVLTIGGVSGTFSVTTLAADTTPAAFTFTPQTGIAVSTLMTSNTITVTGINTGAPVSISGGEYQVNSGVWSTSTSTVNNNDRIAVRQTSSANFVTQTDATLTIGGVSATFSVTTIIDPFKDGTDTLSYGSLTWTTGGDNPWSRVTTTSYYGGDSLQSGLTPTNGTSWLQTQVTGTFTLSFFQKVSSQSSKDYLRFSIDGVEKGKISGNVNWQQKLYSITTGSVGTVHTLRWSYTKDAALTAGLDAGWLDMVRISRYARLALTAPAGGKILHPGDTTTITWQAPAQHEKFLLYFYDGRVDTQITGTLAGSSYDWTVPVTKGNSIRCKIKIVAYTIAGKYLANVLNKPFTIQVLKVTSPNGGDSLARGSTFSIGYTVYGTSGAAGARYSYTLNGFTWVSPGTGDAGAVTTGSHSWSWTVPKVTKASTMCKVKVELLDNAGAVLATDVSDKVFSIVK